MNQRRLYLSLLVAAAVLSAVGCRGRRYADMFYQEPSTPEPLGTYVDEPFRIQEENAEASKYVIYQHEFKLNRSDDDDILSGLRLNEEGEDHVRRIAENLRNSSPYAAPYTVIVERSRTSERVDTRFGYPVHYNAQLDNRRRSVVVSALVAMGIENADELVVVAPAFAVGITGREAERAYRQGMRFSGGGLGGGGNFGGGGFGR